MNEKSTMAHDTRRRSPIAVVIGLCMLFPWGCDDPSILETEGPVLPLSNGRIIKQSVFGDPNLGSFFHDICDDGNGGFYFAGWVDGAYFVGRMARNGEFVWSKNVRAWARCLAVVPDNDVGLTDAFVAVGGIDADSDGYDDQAYVHLIGTAGLDIDRIVIDKPDTNVWLNSVTTIDSFDFVAVGGALNAGSYYPYMVVFSIGTDKKIDVRNDLMIEARPGEYFVTVRVDRNSVSNDEFVGYVLAESPGTDTQAGRVAVHSVGGSTTDVAKFSIEWSVDVPGEEGMDMWTTNRGLAYWGGTLYVAGSTEVVKEENPSNGGYWDAGFVASVSADGHLNWVTVVRISPYSEDYSGLCATSDALYAVGRYGTYRDFGHDRNYGLAFISIFDPFSGKERYHIGLGDEQCSSGFHPVYADGSRAYCAGWTNDKNDVDGNQAWFAEVDISQLGQMAMLELPPTSLGVRGAGELPLPGGR